MMYYCIALHKAETFAVLVGFQVINQSTTIFVPPALTGAEKFVAVSRLIERFEFWSKVIADLQNEKLVRVTTGTGEWCLLPIPEEYQAQIHWKQTRSVGPELEKI